MSADQPTPDAGPVRMSYFGGPGSFTSTAAHQYAERTFGGGQFVLYEEIAGVAASHGDVCRHVQLREADYGVLPIENNLEGVVAETLDALRASDLRIYGEITIPIVHHLLSRTEDVDAIKAIYSHPQALRQSRRWLDRFRAAHPGAEIGTEASTAVAARRAAGEDGCAAIGTEEAAELHGLKVIARDVGDSPLNVTRFWVVGRNFADPTGFDKTTLLVELQNRPGTLRNLLDIFAARKLNMLTIHQRPLEYNAELERMEYYWFLDYEGHINESALYTAFTELVSHRPRVCREAKVLGSYPQSTIPGGGRW